jgi:purine-nucleoside phosphorylase
MGETVVEIPADEVPGFNHSGIPGHTGTIRSVRLSNGKHVLVLGARTHLYEDKGIRAVVHGVRVAAECGAKVMVLTNGAGGIRESWSPGTPVLISDHINLTAASPVEGANFIDLTDLYSARLRAIARSIDPSLDEGVYVQFRGPHYETPAEVQMAKAMGGQIVGMSTALEAIAAREAGMEILGLSLITNLAAGISPHPLSHQEVVNAGRTAEPVVSELLAKIVLAL